jgi:hypothetical protein
VFIDIVPLEHLLFRRINKWLINFKLDVHVLAVL